MGGVTFVLWALPCSVKKRFLFVIFFIHFNSIQFDFYLYIAKPDPFILNTFSHVAQMKCLYLLYGS